MAPLLQPLMDEGSPVADVFDNCLTCDQLTADNTKVSAVRNYMGFSCSTECLAVHTMVCAYNDRLCSTGLYMHVNFGRCAKGIVGR